MAAPTRERSVQERIAEIIEQAAGKYARPSDAAAAIEREIVTPLVAAERERLCQQFERTLDLILDHRRTGGPDYRDCECLAHRQLAAIRATGGAPDGR